MKRIALTGGIAAGKSTISHHLRDASIPVIDYDGIARQLVKPGSDVLGAVKKIFGVHAVDVSGGLNRQWIAENVFCDAAQLEKLNAIMHPAIYQHAWEEDHQLEKNGEKIVVHDIPLLAETWEIAQKSGLTFDVIIDVDAPEDVRVERMIKTRSMTQQQAMHRIHSQASADQRTAIADYVIDSTQPLDQMFAQVDTILNALLSQ